jgi:hypothetical protein
MTKGKQDENIARGGNSYSVKKNLLWFLMLITYLNFFRMQIFVTPLERKKRKKNQHHKFFFNHRILDT